MARKYEYVIHGPPLFSQLQDAPPRHTLSQQGHRHRNSNLRNLFRDSSSPTAYADHFDSRRERSLSSPTTPMPPPTPPIAALEEQDLPGGKSASPADDETKKLRSIPVTPVNGNSPPTPDDTPPRESLKPPIRPFLALRPSLASTRAESFRTAREQIYSDDEFDDLSPDLISAFPHPAAPADLPLLNGDNFHRDGHVQGMLDEPTAVSKTTPSADDKHDSQTTITQDESTPETQLHFNHIREEQSIARDTGIHDPATIPPDSLPRHEKSLSDRLKEKKQVQNTPSTEAFANVIGWNDGRVQGPSTDNAPKRWSSTSNPSAVEAYVIDSPIKPRKRGTLRKVVKNDSLRSASSPIPESNRTSLQSTSDSPHRLVHKKQKLNNQHRWSTGSEFSKRSLSWGSAQLQHKQEIIKVAVIPERRSSLNTSASSSRRHSRSISSTTAPADRSMPPVTTPAPRRKRAFSDSNDKSPSIERQPVIPVRSSSLSAPASRNASRRNSTGSQQLAYTQAEKDLRSTLEKMESERLSASLRRGSDQSDPPTPTPKPKDHSDMTTKSVPTEPLPEPDPAILQASNSVGKRPVTIEINGAAPGTEAWADLRPSTVAGTPYSQISMMSASPDIIEARAINFFPHNNESLQLIEHNRLSDTPAVKALRAQGVQRADTVPSPKINVSTPRTSDHGGRHKTIVIESPLRNPRKPPEPPQIQIAVIPPTPQTEMNKHLRPDPDVAFDKPQNGNSLRRRPSLQDRDRSQSFMQSLSRGFALRNAKNPKADQELDSIQHPFWRPRAFWDDEDYRKRQQQEHESNMPMVATGQGTDKGISRSITVFDDPRSHLGRSNSIYTSPIAIVRRFSERRRQRRLVDDHIAQQQALVKQTSYSSLQRFNAGRRMFRSGLPPIRALTLDLPMKRLGSLRQRITDARSRREDDKREKRRDALRKSIGPEVVMQSDSRFPSGAGSGSGQNPNDESGFEHLGGRKVDDPGVIGEMLQNARAEEIAARRGLRV